MRGARAFFIAFSIAARSTGFGGGRFASLAAKAFSSAARRSSASLLADSATAGSKPSERLLLRLTRGAIRWPCSVGSFDGRNLSAARFAASGWFDTTSENLCGSTLL
jgi:hypothetical protein